MFLEPPAESWPGFEAPLALAREPTKPGCRVAGGLFFQTVGFGVNDLAGRAFILGAQDHRARSLRAAETTGPPSRSPTGLPPQRHQDVGFSRP
jgi:hypothetical protein